MFVKTMTAYDLQLLRETYIIQVLTTLTYTTATMQTVLNHSLWANPNGVCRFLSQFSAVIQRGNLQNKDSFWAKISTHNTFKQPKITSSRLKEILSRTSEFEIFNSSKQLNVFHKLVGTHPLRPPWDLRPSLSVTLPVNSRLKDC